VGDRDASRLVDTSHKWKGDARDREARTGTKGQDVRLHDGAESSEALPQEIRGNEISDP